MIEKGRGRKRKPLRGLQVNEIRDIRENYILQVDIFSILRIK